MTEVPREVGETLTPVQCSSDVIHDLSAESRGQRGLVNNEVPHLGLPIGPASSGFCFVFERDLTNSGWPGTLHVNQVGLLLIQIHLPLL